ncbi:MAG: PilZ domain-containing protein [Spirochaetales bacterium]|nr:PilZ domain-containing protein [Spirochaetales bacterium]
MDTQGNRRFERTDFNVKGSLEQNGSESAARILNVSLKGALVVPTDGLHPQIGEQWTLHIALPHSGIRISTQATMVHQAQNTCGFRFDSIDAEGMIHLRRLLELNLNGEESITRELAFLKDAPTPQS